MYRRAIEREPELELLIPMAVASANDERGAKSGPFEPSAVGPSTR